MPHFDVQRMFGVVEEGNDEDQEVVSSGEEAGSEGEEESEEQ